MIDPIIYILKIILIFEIAGYFLYRALGTVAKEELLDSLVSADLLYTIPAGILLLLSCLLRAYRWKILLMPIKKIKASTLFIAIMIGFTINNLMPARIGELARLFIVEYKSGVSKTTTLATIVVERLFDGMSIILFVAAAILLLPDCPVHIRTAGYLGAAFFFGLFFFMVLLKSKPEPVKRITQKFGRMIPGGKGAALERIVASFIKGLGFLDNPRQIAGVFAYSLIIWITAIGGFYVMGFAYPDLQISILESIFILGAVGIAVMVPVPGFIGVFHEFVKETVLFFAPGKNADAAAYAVVMHAVNYISITAVGLLLIWKEGLSLSFIRKKSTESNEKKTRSE